MAEHIELKYNDLDFVKSGLSMINTNYLDAAYRQLKQSTDLGSSIMQSGWKFGGKDKIFDAVRNAEKQIQRIENGNNSTIGVINQIKQVYETGTFTAAKNNTTAWYKKVLTMLGISTAAVVLPTVTVPAISIWGGRKIISSATKASKKNTAEISSAAKALPTAGITPLKNMIRLKHTDNSPSPNTNTAHSVITVAAISQTVSQELKDIIAEAKRYQALESALAKYANTPYVWGGSSVNGIDCSGLVMQAYKEAGIKADFVHSAAGIYGQCQPVGSYSKGHVDLNALKKGDLVFYSDGGTEAISHVGIYMGDGNVMSALNPSQGVVTKSIDYTNKPNIYVARVAE